MVSPARFGSADVEELLVKDVFLVEGDSTGDRSNEGDFATELGACLSMPMLVGEVGEALEGW